MKKNIFNIKTLAALLIASAAFVACSSDDDIINETQQPINGKYIMTVNASKGDDATTRALSLSGKTLSPKWASTDQVSVFPEAWSTDLTLTPIGTLTAAASDDGSTSLTGDVETTGLSTGNKVQMLFPRATWDYTGQTGVLLSDANSIENKYDYALATPEITVDGSNITADADFESQQAIVKFNLKDAGGSSISASSLTISAAGGKLVQSRGMKKTYTTEGYEDVSGLTGYYVYVETNAPKSKAGAVNGDDDGSIWFDLDETFGNEGCKVVGGVYIYRFKADSEPTSITRVALYKEDYSVITDFCSVTDWGGTDASIAFTNGLYLCQNGTKVDVVTVTEGDPVIGSTYGPLTVTPTSATNELTVALRNELGAADTYTLTADVSGTTYYFAKSGVNFENGKYYEITVKMAEAAKYTDLSTKTSDYPASDGEVLTGKMGANDAQLIIPNNATVTLLNAEFDNSSGNAIQCQGTATIILKGTNVIKSGDCGIQNGGTGTTLILKGTGTLNVKASNSAIGNKWNSEGTGDIEIQSGTYNLEGYVGIGSSWFACGDITISGGTVNIVKVEQTGIGCSDHATCGAITISGGTVITRGGTEYQESCGIGASYDGTCGAITISGGDVTAIAGDGVAIGKLRNSTNCPSVTITTGINSLTMTNSNGTGIVSDFINATDVYANTTPITTLLSTSVTDATVTAGMTAAGFTTDYNSTTKTWTVSK
jgi:hypothetical protein